LNAYQSGLVRQETGEWQTFLISLEASLKLMNVWGSSHRIILERKNQITVK
jgi:hypothetical protein